MDNVDNAVVAYFTPSL